LNGTKQDKLLSVCTLKMSSESERLSKHALIPRPCISNSPRAGEGSTKLKLPRKLFWAVACEGMLFAGMTMRGSRLTCNTFKAHVVFDASRLM
jgi:hypothetical protein